MPSLRFSHINDFGCIMVGAVGGGGGNRLPCVSCVIPVGTRGSESTGNTPERGKSTVAHGKNIAFGDVSIVRSLLSGDCDFLL